MKLNYVFMDEYDKPTHIQMHYHNCFEIVYYHYTNGYTTWKPSNQKASSSLVFTEKESGTYQQINFYNNSLLIIPPNILHDEKHFTNSKLTAIGFILEKKDGSSYSLDLDKPIYFNDKNKKILEYISKIESEYVKRPPFFKESIEILINRCLIALNLNINKLSSDDIIDFSKSYIDEHFTSNIKIEDVAKQANYCPDYFCVLFKEKIGQSPKTYILNKRIDFAKEMLLKSNLSLSEISEHCGFGDYVQYSKSFKKRVGYTPSQYRKVHKKN